MNDKAEQIIAESERLASEDIEKFAVSLTNSLLKKWVSEGRIKGAVYLASLIKDSIVVGANWQEKKDKKILEDEGFVLMPSDEFEKMKRSLINLSEEKEQMMKNAIDSHVNLEWNHPSLAIDWSKIIGLNVGDRVKLIIIKED